MSQRTVEELNPTSGTWVTLCETHRGVQVGVLAVIAADHGSLQH